MSAPSYFILCTYCLLAIGCTQRRERLHSYSPHEVRQSLLELYPLGTSLSTVVDSFRSLDTIETVANVVEKEKASPIVYYNGRQKQVHFCYSLPLGRNPKNSQLWQIVLLFGSDDKLCNIQATVVTRSGESGSALGNQGESGSALKLASRDHDETAAP